VTTKRIAHNSIIVSVAAGTLLLSGCSTTKDADLASARLSDQIAMQRQQEDQQTPSLDNKAVYLDMIRKLQDKSMYFASLAHIDSYRNTYGDTPDLQILRANALRETGQLAQAEEQYRQLLQSNQAAAAWHGLGLLAAKRGNIPQAISSLREAAVRQPADAAILSDLGYALLQNGDVQSARLPLMQATELAPDNRKVISNLALFLMLDGESDKARKLMKEAGISADASREIQRQANEMAGKRQAASSPGKAVALNTEGNVRLQLQTRLLTTPSDNERQ
jgi:Flp pilus assembly protein TadD